MALTTTSLIINSENLNALLKELKIIYKLNNVDENRKKDIIELVNKYGYLPYPHIKALKELTPSETIVALEEKLKLNKTYNQAGFNFDETTVSPVKRAGFQDASWMQKEQHNIKLVNLTGLGNGNESKEPGKFIDWLKQLVILPSGNPQQGVMATTVYLIPFHPREFGCAYIPKHSGVSEALKDESINLCAKDQVRAFIALCQLAGHPVIYDVLPQTGRFSKIVLANPHVARWFSINDFKGIEDEAEKRKMSELMLRKENQLTIVQKVKSIVNATKEDDISNEQHGMLIGALIKEGLWPAPGGAWNSAGTPVFDRMSDDGGHPMFKHYDHEDNDVTHYANLDCQTPYYFVCLEDGEYNENVIEFFINLLKKLQKDYNFDGFRVDHIDHIADKVSEKNLVPISYRAPRTVLARLNAEMKSVVPHFATLAEYMLWDNMYKEYHKEMGFDVLWGNDIISQYQKDVSRIIEDNKQLEEYNKKYGVPRKMSILKAYNNQDGEFRAINQYPGQLGEDGALFKWFKLKFLPGGEWANRPVLFLDGDESFTKTGIEKVICAEESMERAENYDFFAKFDAIDRFAKNISNAKASIHHCNKDTGLVSWLIDNANLMIVAHEKPPIETLQINEEWTQVQNDPLKDITVTVPQNRTIVSEFVYNSELKDFEEKTEIQNLNGNSLCFSVLQPSEFHIYKLTPSL